MRTFGDDVPGDARVLVGQSYDGFVEAFGGFELSDYNLSINKLVFGVFFMLSCVGCDGNDISINRNLASACLDANAKRVEIAVRLSDYLCSVSELDPPEGHRQLRSALSVLEDERNRIYLCLEEYTRVITADAELSQEYTDYQASLSSLHGYISVFLGEYEANFSDYKENQVAAFLDSMLTGDEPRFSEIASCNDISFPTSETN